MVDDSSSAQTTVDTTVLESSVIDQSLLQKVLRQAGRSLAKPALEAMEMLLDESTPAQARLTMLAALTYLLMPIDLVPDLIPVAGFSDDLVALSAVIGLWSNHMTPQIRNRARSKLDRWFPVEG
ncbi:MAG TPA: YkvA family protein [Prochlorococcus sp.]